jgi:hypothetical protein
MTDVEKLNLSTHPSPSTFEISAPLTAVLIDYGTARWVLATGHLTLSHGLYKYAPIFRLMWYIATTQTIHYYCARRDLKRLISDGDR